jgi:hypothetical protein
MSASEPQTLRDEYSLATNILDAKYKTESLDDVIKTCENPPCRGTASTQDITPKI